MSKLSSRFIVLLLAAISSAAIFAQQPLRPPGGATPLGGLVFHVRPEVTYQTMTGFGAGFNASTQAWFDALTNKSDRDAAYRLLYGDDGTELNIVRLTISPSAKPLAQPSPQGLHYDWAGDAGTQKTWEAIAPALKGAHRKVTLYAVPFTPPVQWKTTDSPTHGPLAAGGSLKSEHFKDYAEYLADFLDYQHTVVGVDVDVLSLQNEPDVSAPWPSCTWTANALHDFLLVLAPAVHARKLHPEFMLTEGTKWTSAWAMLQPTLNDQATEKLLGVLASHSYPPKPPNPAAQDEARTRMAGDADKFHKPVWMSEMSLMIPPQLDDPHMPAGLAVAYYLHRDIVVGHASAWIYCFAIFTYNFKGSMGVLSPADNPQTMGQLVVPKRFWTMANYSRFVKPGWKLVQVGSTESVLNTAFISPDGRSWALVVVNTTDKPQVVTYEFSSPLQGAVEAFATTEQLNLGQVAAPSAQAHGISATLQPSSVITFTGRIEGASPFPGGQLRGQQK